MELFFTNNIEGDRATLDPGESLHCTKVMRHTTGERINFTDGAGGLYLAEIISTQGKETRLQIISCDREYQKRDYYLHMAVAPTKNPDRYEWFIEKAVELGIDEITPLEGEHSQKRVFKKERVERLILSAMKQSLKTRLPVLNPMTKASALIIDYKHREGWTKLIGHCRESKREVITSLIEQSKKVQGGSSPHKILIMIGPEGDFSVGEIEQAINSGFLAFHMGESRMRTETAALTAVCAVYLGHIC